MEQFVEHVVEPDRLLLAWQAPDHMKNRRRWVVGLVEVRSEPWTLVYLHGTAFEEANPGATYAELISLGFEGYPAFAIRGGSGPFDRGVREAFLRRLPPRSRPDFSSYIRRFGFHDGMKLSDAALLAYTEAKLPSDGFSLVGELKPEIAIGDFIFDLAGTRYQDFGDVCPAAPGDLLQLRKEPTNKFDSGAIEVLWKDSRVGYVNRLQAKAVGYWMDHRKIQVIVQRINGRPGNPKIYALVHVRPQNGSLAA